MQETFSYRLVNLFCFLICSGLIAFALYLQFAENQQPCPLCIIQRLMIMLLIPLFLLGSIWHPRTIIRRIYSGVILIISLIGTSVASLSYLHTTLTVALHYHLRTRFKFPSQKSSLV